MDTRFRFTRLVRTETSEIHLAWEEGQRVAQIDLHLATGTIYATIILERHLSVTSEQELIAQFDDEVVTSYLSRYDRIDFFVTVFRGEEVSSYTDSGDFEEEDEGEEDELDVQ